MEEKVAATSLAIFFSSFPPRTIVSFRKVVAKGGEINWKSHLENVIPVNPDGHQFFAQPRTKWHARGAATPSPLIAAQSFDRKLSCNVASPFPIASRFVFVNHFAATSGSSYRASFSGNRFFFFNNFESSRWRSFSSVFLEKSRVTKEH